MIRYEVGVLLLYGGMTGPRITATALPPSFLGSALVVGRYRSVIGAVITIASVDPKFRFHRPILSTVI